MPCEVSCPARSVFDLEVAKFGTKQQFSHYHSLCSSKWVYSPTALLQRIPKNHHVCIWSATERAASPKHVPVIDPEPKFHIAILRGLVYDCAKLQLKRSGSVLALEEPKINILFIRGLGSSLSCIKWPLRTIIENKLKFYFLLKKKLFTV